MLKVEVQGEELLLLPEKAIFRRQCKTLIVSDLHWGKTAHFRKHGIAIPLNTQQNDEIRLARLVQEYKAERIVIAGDLFHSAENNEVNNFSHWRKAHAQLSIELVTGNHDKLPPELYAGHGITMMGGLLDMGSFNVSHDELERPERFYIHGHIHPSFVVNGKGRNSIKLPCFCMDSQRLVLPSFGSFTGSHKITSSQYKHIYVIAEDEVIQWQ